MFFIFCIIDMIYMIYVLHPRYAGGRSLGEALGGGIGHLIAPLSLVFYALNAWWMWKIAKGIASKLAGPKPAAGKKKAE